MDLTPEHGEPRRRRLLASALWPGLWPALALLGLLLAAAAPGAGTAAEATAEAETGTGAPTNNCAGLAGACVCLADDVAQCVDTDAADLTFLRGLRNRSRFSELIVYHNNIPALPDSVFHSLQLSNLRTVRLAYNGIVSVDPRAFHGMRKLKKLVLVRNSIRGLHPATFHNNSKLSLLDLSNNLLADVASVRHVANLEDCRVANNSISALPARAFCTAAVCRLKALNLANNEISSVDSRAFQGLHGLETLNLAENALAGLHPHTFLNTTNLRELDLRRNRISAVTFVCQVPSLKFLFLSSNRIASVSNDTFVCGLPSFLIHVDLADNRIAAVEPGAFRGLHNVLDLSLARNLIEHIHPSTFLNATNLRSLDLRHNRISELHFVRDIIMLWSLDLSHNEIAAIPPETFVHQNLTQLISSGAGVGARINATAVKFVLARSIASISLAHNRLRTVERGALEGLYKLYQLDLSGNNISHVSPDAFQRNSQLTHVSVRGNTLPSLEVLLAAPNLETCDASENALSTLPATLEAPKLRSLSLAGNSLSRLSADAFANLTQLTSLDLSGNAVQSTAFARALPGLEKLLLPRNALTALPAAAFAAPAAPGAPAPAPAAAPAALKVLDLAHNAIADVHPDAFLGLWQLQVLNASHNQLSALPAQLFVAAPRLRELQLAANRLARLDFLAPLSQLRMLSVANNSLANAGLAPDALASAPHLHALDLSGNALRHVREPLFQGLRHLLFLDLARNRISDLPALAFRNASRLRTLRLAGNRLQGLSFLAEAAASLEECDASDNAIAALPGPLFPGAGARPRLARLDLSRNRLSAVSPAAFRGLARLHSLQLAGNELTALPPAALLPCGTLLQLGLAGNRLGRLADLPHAPRLKHLYLPNNPLPPLLANDSLAGSRLSQVVHLNLSGCGLAAVEAGALRPLRVLRYLDLSRNALAALPDGLFTANTLLSALDLSHNSLLSLGALVQPARCLEFLDASGNALAAVADGAFRDQLRYIDLSRNAIAELGPAAFRGLHKLQVLDLRVNRLVEAPAPAELSDRCAVLLAGNPALGPETPASAPAAADKRFYDLRELSISELDKFAKLYMYIEELNNRAT